MLKAIVESTFLLICIAGMFTCYAVNSDSDYPTKGLIIMSFVSWMVCITLIYVDEKIDERKMNRILRSKDPIHKV